MTRKLIRNLTIIVCLATIIFIPGTYIINNYLSNQKLEFENLLFGILFTALVTIAICSANIATFIKFRKNHHKGYLKMMVLEVIVTTFNAAVIMALVIFICYRFFDYPELEATVSSIYFNNILIAIIVNLIVMGFVEAYTLFTRWKIAAIESERLLREKADARYSALKNQVNPHFLFNSLNSLSSLIRKSPEKAIEFVDKFSKIYRYVLDSSEMMLIELREELNFIQSFIYLQKIRFGENLVIDINVSAAYMNYYLPPLSVQLLLENAIKHNEISSEYPLSIYIYIEDSFLVVKNTVRLKNSMEKSTGIGLKNLEERYKHFSDRTTSFSVINGQFVAILPLLTENEL